MADHPAGCICTNCVSDKRDAARYRWLRAQHWTDSEYAVTRVSNLQPGMQSYSAENLDSVIDNALRTDQLTNGIDGH